VSGDEWNFWSYASLAESARRVASGLRSLGVGHDDVVSIVLPSGPGFVAALFGTMLAGAVPSPLAPPMAFQDLGVYDDHVTGVLRTAQPRLVVTDLALTTAIGQLARRADVASVTTVDEVLASGTSQAGPSRPASLALLQFTSGSSGRARGVRISCAALEANVSAMREWLRMTSGDAIGTWLPLHHDMGLIGCLVTPVMNRSDVWVMQPEQFVHSPVSYLRWFGERGAKLTAMPTFGLAYIVRRVRPEMLEGFDFSRWRGVVVGAERLDADVFDQFHRLLAPFGFQRSAILPAYGLAEATLAVTALPPFAGWRSVAMRPGPRAIGTAITLSDTAADSNAVVGCGRPLTGTSVTVVDERGQPLPDGHVGEIVVRSPSVASGYLHGEEPSSLTSIDAGSLVTGDAGFLLDGELYVLGRLGDSLKIRGRAVFAEDIEAALTTAGLPGHRLAVALGIHDGQPTAVAVLEHPRPDWTELAEQVVRRRTDGACVVVAPVSRGAITRTSSGKPKRRLLWHSFVGGTLMPIAADRVPPTQGVDGPA
jgi:acyl-CoA synthetase (AMP-forming)/AMP-acid ligase II